MPFSLPECADKPTNTRTVTLTDRCGASGVSTQLTLNGNNTCMQLKASPNGQDTSFQIERKSKYFVINVEYELVTFERFHYGSTICFVSAAPVI